jgi:hypothetical protein
LTVVVMLAMLIWGVVYVAVGLRTGIRLLRGSAAAGLPPPGERAGVVILLGVFGVLAVFAIVIGALVTEREAELVGLGPKIDRLESQVRTYQDGVKRLEETVESGAKAADASVNRLAADLRKQLADLRQRLDAQR